MHKVRTGSTLADVTQNIHDQEVLTYAHNIAGTLIGPFY